MAWIVNHLASNNNGETSSGSLAVSSVPVTATRRLFAFATAQNDTHQNTRAWSIGDTLALTWTKYAESTMYGWGNAVTPNNYALNCVVWYADVPANGTTTITVDPGAGNYFIGADIFEVKGFDVASPFTQSPVTAGARVNPPSNSASGSVTFGTAPTSGNLVLALFGVGGDNAGACAIPSGFTTINNQSDSFAHASTFYSITTNTITVTSTDLGQTVGNWGGIIVEMSPELPPEPSEKPIHFIPQDMVRQGMRRLYGRDNVFTSDTETYTLPELTSTQFRAMFLFVDVALQNSWLWFELDADGQPVETELSDSEQAEIDSLISIMLDAI